MAIKFKTGTIIYGKKPEINLGKCKIKDIQAKITEVLGPMVPIKIEKSKKILEQAKKDRTKGKCLNPLVKVGQVDKDLLLVITADKGYEESSILVKKYDSLKKAAEKAGTVINLDPDDNIINKASATQAKKHKTTAKTGDEVDLSKKGDTAPIVILAHGGSAVSKGKVYAKNFAGKKPNELVKFLVKDKKLPKNFAGIIYLDGCFTAAGKTDMNFAKKVYDALVKLGYKYLQVKGNLGEAVTMADGTESVLDAQEQKKAHDDAKKAVAALKKADTKKKLFQKIWDNVWVEKYADDDDTDGFFADSMIKKILPDLVKFKKDVEKQVKEVTRLKKVLKDMDKTYKYDIPDLIGTFGPEKLRKHKWYNKIFK